MRRIVITFILLHSLSVLHAQIMRDSVFVLPDSVKPFTIQNFFELIIQHHPVVKQTLLLSETAKQEIRLARGSFDPKIETQFLLKHYNDTEYYRLFDAALKVPTRSPITTTIGVERNTGENLNPEHYISNEYNYRQLYVGIAVPLGKGLLTDERRTTLKQAQLFGDMMEAEQIKLTNKLLLEAAKDYWEWYYSFYNYRLAHSTVTVAEEIFRRTKLNFQGGEVSAIDTVQARITLLERLVNQQESLNSLKNQTLKISTYLWDSLQNPVELPPTYAPAGESDMLLLTSTDVKALVDMAKANHPELRKLNVKLQQLELDRKLFREYMKPQVDLSYYKLNQPFSPEGINSNFTWNDNYKFGLDFSFPIFLRKERAKLEQTKLKLTNTKYDRDLAYRQILNDINTAYNELVNNGLVLQQQRAAVSLYYTLINAEMTNLENGESDLFKINIQQEKLFNAQSKLIKGLAAYEKQKAILYWSAGTSPLSAIGR
ncbi:TolC family protein [Pseudochryseolinea flava]|nr:TolC family protein [Pseudochryseolinea flava]